MKLSSLMGLSAGCLAMSAYNAVDVGTADPLFFPLVALAVVALVGLVGAARSWAGKKPREPLQWGRLVGFAALGGVVVMVAAVAVIAALNDGQ